MHTLHACAAQPVSNQGQQTQIMLHELDFGAQDKKSADVGNGHIFGDLLVISDF